MNLKNQIVQDLTAAMRAGEELNKSVLRMLKAEIMKEEVAGNAKRELADAEITKIVKKLIKQRLDSAEQFEKGDRAEMAAQERAELKVLEKYLPQQLTPEVIREIAEKKKAELGITDRAKMGILIGAVMKEVGDTADGGAVKEIVGKLF